MVPIPRVAMKESASCQETLSLEGKTKLHG